MTTTTLDDLEIVDTAIMTVKDAQEEPLMFGEGENKRAATITYWAPGSEAYVAADMKRSNRNIRRVKHKQEMTAELFRADQINFLVEVTKEFDLPPYNAAAGATGDDLLRAIYEAKRLDIADQGTNFLADRARFKKGSATS